MNAELLLEHFHRIGDVPDAVQRLRRFVLDLAVRGKLVPQNPNEKPAPGLVKQIDSKKFALHEVPYGTWRKVAAGTVLDFHYGKGLHIRERSDVGPVPVYGSNGIIGYCKSALVMEPAIIVGRKGSAGALNVCDGPSWTTDVAYYVVPPPFIDIRYLMIALHTLDMGKLGKGVKPGLSRSDAYEQLLPIPPFAEQHRIVVKVDELMALCDRLEAARTERETKRDRLTAASLARLNTPDSDPATFTGHARFTLDNLSAITTRRDQIKQLRQTILNLAVRGKLVPQDPNDEPALILPVRTFGAASGLDDEVFNQFRSSIELRPGWRIEPLAHISEHVVDCPHTTPKWTDAGEICVRTNQIRPGSLDLTQPRYVSRETYLERIERLEPRTDDILYSREGGILGVACRVPKNVRLCLGQRLMLIRSRSIVCADFLEAVLNSPFITDIAKIRTTGGAAPRVNMSTVRGYPIPLPPLAEQHRIVAKVEELMALCDQLESGLATAADTRRRLLDALLTKALAPAETELEAVE